jgi:hypothetical protein
MVGKYFRSELIAGAAFGIAFFLKISCAFVIFPLTLAYLILACRSLRLFIASGATIVLGFMAVISPYVLYAWSTHSLGDFWLLVVEYNKLYSARRSVLSSGPVFIHFLADLFRGFNYLPTPLALTGTVALAVSFGVGKSSRNTWFVLLAGLSFALGGLVVCMLVGGEHDTYWALPVIGFAILTAGLLRPEVPFAEAVRAVPALTIALGVWLLPINIMSWPRLLSFRDYNLSHATIAAIRDARAGDRDASVFIWGTLAEMLVGEKLQPATRILHPLFLVRDRTIKGAAGDAFYEHAWQVFRADFADKPADLIVIVKSDVQWMRIGPESNEAERLRQVVTSANVCYIVRHDDDTATVLVRVAAAPVSPTCLEGLRALAVDD